MNIQYRLARFLTPDVLSKIGHALFWVLFLGSWIVAQIYATALDEVSR